MSLSLSALRKEKQISRKGLKKKYPLSQSSQSLLFLDIADSHIRNELIEACTLIDISVFLSSPTHDAPAPVYVEKDFAGFDIFVTDMERTFPIIDMMHAWVVPILPEKNSYGTAFTQFNPMRFEGNAFLYKKMNVFSIFEQIIRYLEDVRFPEDKNILLQNVIKTF